MKTLYTFKIKKPTIVENKSKDEAGNEVITKTTEKKDVEIHIKKPSHREIDEMDLFYSIQISDLQAKGIATNTMILNSYQDSGGLDSKKEVEAMKKLIEELNVKKNRLIKDNLDKIQNPSLLEEIKELSVQITDYQNRLSAVFERSAESIAERRVVMWGVLSLLFTKENDIYSPIFSGKNYNDKLENYYNLIDSKEKEDDFIFEQAVFEKGQIFLSLWLKKQAESKEDFQLLESMLDEAEEEEDAS